MNLRQFLNSTVKTKKMTYNDGTVHYYQQNRKRVVCEDGTSLSVQHSCFHYCSPRQDGVQAYSRVEVGYIKPTNVKIPESWNNYGEGDTEPSIWSYIPVEFVEDFINSHGGIAN